MCKVSVIIPVYNAQKTLRKSVESLVYGKLKDIEIILVDDCSKDESWKLCKLLACEYAQVKCIQNIKNSGPSFTRNQGLLESKGEYISFVDSDDWVSGEFLTTLYEVANQNKDSIVTCGFSFVNQLSAENVNYIWNKQEEHCKIYTIEGIKLFDAVDKIMLQNIWNKLFLRESIIEHGIRFDEKQMMGEDFQFVLDYMEAMHISKCKIINQPLYYYVRANNSSLMSKFGWYDTDQEQSRLEQLAQICGNDISINSCLQNMIKRLKKNYIYHICRSRKVSKEKKIRQIEKIMQDGKAKKYYYLENKNIVKETLYCCREKSNILVMRVFGRLKRGKRDALIKQQQKKLIIHEPITIISQNCIGAVFSHDMGWPFLSPTVNLYFGSKDFMKFVLNLEEYSNMELVMEWGEKWPIGHLGDITIQFMHYETCTDAKESWNRRKERIDLNRILVLATDREGFTKDVYKMWNTIKYPKLLFTAQKKFSGKKGVVYYSKYEKEGCVPDLIPDREFYKEDLLIKSVNRI